MLHKKATARPTQGNDSRLNNRYNVAKTIKNKNHKTTNIDSLKLRNDE